MFDVLQVFTHGHRIPAPRNAEKNSRDVDNRRLSRENAHRPVKDAEDGGRLETDGTHARDERATTSLLDAACVLDQRPTERE